MSSSAFPSFWQRAWDEAQPYLQQQSASSPGTLTTISERVNRVGQLDAEVLDSELVQLVQEPINRALSLVNVRIQEAPYCARLTPFPQPTLQSKLEPELLLLIRIILHKFSLWDLGATYGAKLQDLRYVSTTGYTRQWIASTCKMRLLLND
jgi:peroxin-2